jgi:hypothetical protein
MFALCALLCKHVCETCILRARRSELYRTYSFYSLLYRGTDQCVQLQLSAAFVPQQCEQGWTSNVVMLQSRPITATGNHNSTTSSNNGNSSSKSTAVTAASIIAQERELKKRLKFVNPSVEVLTAHINSDVSTLHYTWFM